MWHNTLYVPFSSIISSLFMFQFILISFEVPPKKQDSFYKTANFLIVKNTNNEEQKKEGEK